MSYMKNSTEQKQKGNFNWLNWEFFLEGKGPVYEPKLVVEKSPTLVTFKCIAITIISVE